MTNNYNNIINKFNQYGNITIRLSKSNRKNAKTKELQIHYVTRYYQNLDTELKKHITHDDLLNALDFICANKKEYKNIQLFFNDIYNTYTSNKGQQFYSLEDFIQAFIKLAFMLDNAHDNMPHFFRLDNSGMTDDNINYYINKYYHN